MTKRESKVRAADQIVRLNPDIFGDVILRASDISQIPVLDDDELIGVIDEEDILFSVKKDRSSFKDEVRVCMVTNLDILQADASEDDLVGILTQGKVAIIYDGKKFIGFVTKVDLINHYRTRIDQVS